jgi:predicted CoA-binding protein
MTAMEKNDAIEALLKMRGIAVVGCSPKPERASHQIAAYLQEAGYRVFPVNPGHAQILQTACFASLSAIEEPVDVVNVFRRPEHVPDIVAEAIKIGAKGIWLQDGIDHPAAAAAARERGLIVVADDCIMRQHLSRFR